MTEDFAKTRYQDPPCARREDGDTAHFLEPSRAEKLRVIRALYIIEIFFILFREISLRVDGIVQSAENEGAMVHFFKSFAHWEVEQIACAHDFLFTRVSPVFNDMAEHDVDWGASKVVPAQWVGSWPLQSFLFKGLVAIEKLAETKTYGERYKLFDHGRIPVRRAHTLFRALYKTRNNIPGENLGSCLESPQSYASIFKSPFFDDPDDGAFTAWKWAFGGIYRANRGTLHKWGFVMWDRARLGTLSSLMTLEDIRGQSESGEPWKIRWFSHDDPVGEVEEETWASSWEKRAAMYEKGGRGWWDFGDESNIVWS
ncbi:hypothetical protein EKO27_g4996 [Xylaria grammica]|uniref:Uncharacterized protein n=1 Tax=Xylaria grammica TaxID=363999 RepID=A0A439D6R4_9PEZI|nr:hypothetical protein EKO27_g4996 [Xylaria grammica]